MLIDTAMTLCLPPQPPNLTRNANALVVRPKLCRLSRALAVSIMLFTQILVGCGRSTRSPERSVEPIYDRATGKLQLVKYDSDGDGEVDNWTYMDGTMVLRTEFDTNHDGKVDRWQYYRSDGKIEKIGLSTKIAGQADQWVYLEPDGAISRIESSPKPDGKFRRAEHFQKGVMTRAEEDTDSDGQIDKWETYDGARLATVAFDTRHRGVPDRRLVYDADGTVRIEFDVQGDGHFVSGGPSAADPRNRRQRLP